MSPLKIEGLAKYIVKCKAATVARTTLPFVDLKNDKLIMASRRVTGLLHLNFNYQSKLRYKVIKK